jgi:hypothetical protein
MPLAEIDAGDISGEADFRNLVVDTCEPAVIRGLVSAWPATQAASASVEVIRQYLVGYASERAAEAFVGEHALSGRYHYGEADGTFNFARQPMTLAEAVRRIVDALGQPDAPTIYVGSLPTDSYLPGFAEANAIGVVPAPVRPRIWIGHRSTAACHHDNFDNLACVVAGERRFTLFPPDAICELYVGPIDHTLAGQPISLAAGADVDDPRYPRFAAVRDRALLATLGPGDGIYIPKLWWHQVEATAPFNILVNYWWDAFANGPDSPHTTMLLAMAAIAERPAAERRAWSAFFDHYVFRPNGHPLAHLSEERHGILGVGQQGRLRAIVMRLLRG